MMCGCGPMKESQEPDILKELCEIKADMALILTDIKRLQTYTVLKIKELEEQQVICNKRQQRDMADQWKIITEMQEKSGQIQKNNKEERGCNL